MKILLVKPYNISDHIQPSLGLGYLASAVRGKHDVKIVDCIKEGIDLNKFASLLKREKPDVLGLQCYTFDLPFVDAALKIAKETDSNIVTVLGGPHPSALPQETIRSFKGNLDFLFTGESEIGFSALLDSIGSGRRGLDSVPGLVRMEDGVVKVVPRVVVDDLDSLGMPAWDLIHPETYPESQHGAFFKKFPIAPIMVTRGCPYPCTFCAGGVVSGKKIRTRSIDSVLAEIKLLYNDFGIREFHIIDDNFTMDKAYAKEFLRRLGALNLDISWAVPNGVRMETLDEELLNLMKKTGLYLVSLGIESGNDKVLKLMKKGTNVKKITECVRLIDKAGIDMAGFFIIGFPGEDINTIKDTIRFAASLPIKRANFFTYLPFPGSESYNELYEKNELGEVDWEKFHFTNAAYVPRGMTRRTLKGLHRLAFARFYLRPGIMFYQIKSIKSFRHLLFLTKRFFRWIVAG